MIRSKKTILGIVTAVIVAMGLAGMGMLLYPTVSDWWNTTQQVNAIAEYDHVVKEMDTAQIDDALHAAEQYNAWLAQRGMALKLSPEETKDYDSLLNISGDGIMGVIEIPKINVTLPIFHGTSEEALSEAVGHIAGTSLPVGGPGTHCCLSGHRGLPSARLFTDLTSMEMGDKFVLLVLNRTMTYEVDDVRTVLPDEVDSLTIDAAQDYVTLVTCTPYGVNTHRLLVRGHRIPNDPEDVRLLADAVQIKTPFVAMGIAVLVIVCATVWLALFIHNRIRRRRILEVTELEFQKRLAERKKRQ